MTKRARVQPFTAGQLLDESRILDAAAVLMDGRSSTARMYRRLAAMLRYASLLRTKAVFGVLGLPVKRAAADVRARRKQR